MCASARRLTCLIALAVALLFLAPPVAGATKTWADGTGQWNTSGNWSPSGQPQAGNDVLLTQSDATDRIVTYYNTTNPTALLSSLKIDATGTGTMTLDMPNNHGLKVTTEYVGYSGKGKVTQSAGASDAATLYLGYNAGSNGSYTITGGTLASTSDQYIGRYGTGALNIQNGSQASNSSGYLGYYSGSSGTVTVTGNGSKWTNSGGIHVGLSGSGTLNIEAGGQVSDDYGSINEIPGSTATVTVTGTGSKWTNSNELRIWSGTLNIEKGGQVSNAWDGYVGRNAGSTGTATVTGANSRWNSNGYFFYVGYDGKGVLNIQAGGLVVTADSGCLGYHAGSTGTATVTGANSKWTNGGELYVGYYGSGTLTVADGGQADARVLYASLSDLLGNGTISARQGAVLDADLFFDGTHGTTQTLSFDKGGTLSLKVTQDGSLGAGYKGTGTLRIADGITVASASGCLGYWTGSSGTATVTGTGSKWINGSGLTVGSSGSGTLKVEAGGQVSSTRGFLGVGSGATGTATVTGSESKWTNSDFLLVGDISSGTLTVADNGKVMAKSVSVDSKSAVGTSAVRLHVSGNDMLVLGDDATAGKITNNGTVSFYADSFLAAKVYAPISEYSGKAITWTGTGSYKAYGGMWSDAAKTFTVEAPTELAAGGYDTLSTGERLLFTDPGSGKRVGASFGDVAGTPKFSAAMMSQDELDALVGTPGFEGKVLSAWEFDTDYSGGDNVLLSFEIGLGAEDLGIWHYNGGAWSQYAPDLETYDAGGIFSFTATDFSGWAVTAIPEPATLALMVLGGLALLRRKGGYGG